MTSPCFECHDLGFTVADNGSRSTVRNCWRIGLCNHNEPNAAAAVVRAAVERLTIREVRLDPQALWLATILTRHTSARPFDKHEILNGLFIRDLRTFHSMIEHLRGVWRLPVGSRRHSPAGYWIITDPHDFEEWVADARRAPVTQLATIAAVARVNFPWLAGQLELEIWQEMYGSDSIRQMRSLPQ